MLLHEITLDANRLNRHPKQLGKGVQGIAFDTNKPNTIRKVYGLDSFDDPYYQFIKTIEQHQDNPFFPRIYRHHVYKNKRLSQSRISDYKMTGIVMMEKLQPLYGGRIDNDTIVAMFENLGIKIETPDDLHPMFDSRNSIQQAINTTTNDKFAEALQILLSSGRRMFDLHAGNWMVRLTSVGPQIVILDPVYGSDVNSIPEADLKQLSFELAA